MRTNQIAQDTVGFFRACYHIIVSLECDLESFCQGVRVQIPCTAWGALPDSAMAQVESGKGTTVEEKNR